MADMADVIDKAAEREEQLREAAIKHRKPEGPRPTGACLFCGAYVPASVRWCDADCRDDWERLQKR